ncbi:hypothetical protein MMC21_006069 [Puttea exsequens]|nr:hypothetical protein [Puttea exsequens]
MASANTTPIAQLEPGLDPFTTSVFGVVTLLWPYAASTKQLSLLLVEPDFRLRRNRGQVRLYFTGASAKAVARASVSSGDQLHISLIGTQFTKDASTASTPGRNIEWELRYGGRVVLQIHRADQEPISIDIDNPIPSPEQPKQAPVEPLSPPLNGYVQRKPQKRQLDEGEWDSPAFLKRGRISASAFDPFAEEDFPDNDRKKRPKFGRRSDQWRFAERTPSPEKEVNATTYDYSSPSRVQIQKTVVDKDNAVPIETAQDLEANDVYGIKQVIIDSVNDDQGAAIVPLTPPKTSVEHIETQPITSAPLSKSLSDIEPSVASSASSLSAREWEAGTLDEEGAENIENKKEKGDEGGGFIEEMSDVAIHSGSPSEFGFDGSIYSKISRAISFTEVTQEQNAQIHDPGAGHPPQVYYEAPKVKEAEEDNTGVVFHDITHVNATEDGSPADVIGEEDVQIHDVHVGGPLQDDQEALPVKEVEDDTDAVPQDITGDFKFKGDEDQWASSTIADGLQAAQRFLTEESPVAGAIKNKKPPKPELQKMLIDPLLETQKSPKSPTQSEGYRLDDNFPVPDQIIDEELTNKVLRSGSMVEALGEDASNLKSSEAKASINEIIDLDVEDYNEDDILGREIAENLQLPPASGPDVTGQSEAVIMGYQGDEKAHEGSHPVGHASPTLQQSMLRDAGEAPRSPLMTILEPPKVSVAQEFPSTVPETVPGRSKTQLMTPDMTQRTSSASEPSFSFHEPTRDHSSLPTPQLTQCTSADLLPAQSPVLQPLQDTVPVRDISPPPQRRALAVRKTRAPSPKVHEQEQEQEQPSTGEAEPSMPQRPLSFIEKLKAMRKLSGQSPRRASDHSATSPWFAPRNPSQIVSDSESESEVESTSEAGRKATKQMPVSAVQTPQKQKSLAESFKRSPVLRTPQHRPLPSVQSSPAYLPPSQPPPAGFRTAISYYVPLPTLISHFGTEVDVLAIALAATPVTRATSGPKNYNQTIHITDPAASMETPKTPVISAQIFRPNNRCFPIVEKGDAILLRDFKVQTLNRQATLLSTQSSAWAVFRRSMPRDVQMRGPPVELGPEERMFAEGLWRWQDNTTQTEKDMLDGKVPKERPKTTNGTQRNGVSKGKKKQPNRATRIAAGKINGAGVRKETGEEQTDDVLESTEPARRVLRPRGARGVPERSESPRKAADRRSGTVFTGGLGESDE